MGDARRRSLALQTPRNLRTQTAPQRTPVEQRTCLMSQAGQCRVSFMVAGSEGRFMCHRHWALVPEELRQKLAADFATTRAAFEAWQALQREVVTHVRKANGTID